MNLSVQLFPLTTFAASASSINPNPHYSGDRPLTRVLRDGLRYRRKGSLNIRSVIPSELVRRNIIEIFCPRDPKFFEISRSSVTLSERSLIIVKSTESQ